MTLRVPCPAGGYRRSVRGQGQSVLWVPSQNGGVPVCLQPHSATFCDAVISNFTGVMPVTLCEPSQNG